MMNPVVVGVDGSSSAIRATRWAAAEAVQRKVPLRIVSVYQWPVTGYPEAMIAAHGLHDALKKRSTEIVAEAREAALAIGPDLTLTVDVRSGAPLPHLLALSKRAGLVVVGSRGLGGFSGLLLGSVAVGMAAHADCPVIVVRGEPGNGPVVVGVDGSPVSEAAIAFAFEEASTRDADLVAVHTWRGALVDALEDGYFASYLDTIGVDAEELLAERLAGWQEKFPDVAITRVVARGSAKKVLMEYAVGAQLVVLGSRGRGGFTGLTMGSTSQAMIHHASCPVAVLRSPESG
jgi:nucleotide-binding universal stress UspA family protein